MSKIFALGSFILSLAVVFISSNQISHLTELIIAGYDYSGIEEDLTSAQVMLAFGLAVFLLSVVLYLLGQFVTRSQAIFRGR